MLQIVFKWQNQTFVFIYVYIDYNEIIKCISDLETCLLGISIDNIVIHTGDLHINNLDSSYYANKYTVILSNLGLLSLAIDGPSRLSDKSTLDHIYLR